MEQAVIHVIIERPDLAAAIAKARTIYNIAVRAERHVLLDAPGEFRTNWPTRRPSAADVLISVRQPMANAAPIPAKPAPSTINQPAASAA